MDGEKLLKSFPRSKENKPARRTEPSLAFQNPIIGSRGKSDGRFSRQWSELC
jgi:hypothetical protein